VTHALTAAATRTWRDALRDPVLIAPLAVAAGLGIGALGEHAGVSGARLAVDIGLAWALAAIALLTIDRPRRRRAGVLLAAAAFALLGADLEWSSASVPWTFGLLIEQLWVALLATMVLLGLRGRLGSRLARWVIACTFAITVAGQAVGALVDRDPRDLISVWPDAGATHAVDRAQQIGGVALAIGVLLLLVRELQTLHGPARRVQEPVLAGAVVTIAIGVVWLVTSRFETIARAAVLALPVGVAAGLLWSRLARPEPSQLVVELRAQTPATIGERLAAALDDPTLELAYRLADDHYVDAAGRPFELPRAPERAITPITTDGEEIAVLVHDPVLLDDPRLVESVRATAALVLEIERLAAEVRSQLAEVRASRERIVSATDAERRRIERDLHDGAQQRLVTLSVALGLESSRLDPTSADVLSRAQDEVEQAIAELRELARGIHPTLLRDEGLVAAVEALARRAPLPVTLDGTVEGRLPGQVELAAYFVVSEALTNVVKHAAATSAAVLIDRQADVLRISVTDDGVGGAQVAPGSGLAGLRDRLDALDATLMVDSRPGHGTTIRAELPCAS
jgi:signal transduction histidine kinase